MKKQLWILGIFALLVAVLAVSNVSAATSPSYYIEKVKVNSMDVPFWGSEAINVERGETAYVEIWFVGTGTEVVDNARVKAWIGGYEYNDIEDRSDIMEIQPGVHYREVLRLEIPEDIDVDEDNYKLNVQIYDDQYSTEYCWDIKISVREQRHLLNIQDVILNPEMQIEAGKTLFGKVRVENLGYKKEEDIKVTMSIPELGLSTRTYIDELVTSEECAVEDCDDDEETSMTSDELYLRIPDNVQTGDYEVVIEVEYNRGHDVVEETYLLHINGRSRPSFDGAEPEVVISVDSTSQKVEQGAGVVYKVSFVNLGDEARSFSLDVSGEGLWATSRVDPSTVVVLSDETAEMYIYLSANEDATVGQHLFTVSVSSNGEVLKDFNLKADVTEAEGSASYGNLRRGLEIGFIVLLIILVILGLVLAARRLGKGNDEEIPGKESYY